MKSGASKVSSIPILILMSKIIFVKKYLLPVGQNWSQNRKYSEFIEIWQIKYFKYVNLNFNVKNNFYEKIFTTCWAKNWSRNWKCSELIEIWHIWSFKYTHLDFNVKIIFTKYLPIVKPKLVPKSKILGIFWKLTHLLFQVCQSLI